MNKTILSCALVLSTSLGATAAFADYPERAINMVIPYGAGGATDISARTIAEPLGEAVGKPLIMANITGAGGATGSVAVQNASADGYTMLFARVGSHSVNPAMKATLPYTLDDFRFVNVYEINPAACAVSANSDIASMDDLIAKVADGGVTYSSSGVGSFPHLASAMVMSEFDVDPMNDVTHIPQQGGGAAITAVLNGTATFVCTNSSSLASFVANNQLTPLLVTTAEPVVGFDAPTANDLGKDSLNQLVGWTGIAGPDDLPDDIAAKWGEWMATATSDAKFVESMTARGSVIRLMGPVEANEFIQGQYNVFRALVDELGMRIEG